MEFCIPVISWMQNKIVSLQDGLKERNVIFSLSGYHVKGKMEPNTFYKKIRDSYSTRYAYIKNDICITYAELYKLIDVNRKSILEQGINKEDCVILRRKDQLEFIILFLSLLSIGCYIVPVSYDITEFELDKVTKKVMPKTLDDIQVILHCGEVEEEQDSLDFYSGDDCGIYHMTSGSTGEEKYCVRTFHNLYAEAQSYVETGEYSCNDRIISTAPLNHSYALGAVIIPALLSGACVYTLNGLSPVKVMKMVEQEKITVIITVPAIVKMLCLVNRKSDFSTVRMVLAGAGVITEELYKTFMEKFNTHLYGNYGSTETGGLICRLKDGGLQNLGEPMQGVLVKVCDENGECVKDGTEGELYVLSDAMMKGYLFDKSNVFDQDGYFKMGDIVVKEGNEICLKGRKKLFINVAGKKVNPLEVENVLNEIAAVKECVVCGGTKKNGEEIVKAYIVKQSEISEEEIRLYCRTKLSEIKVPSHIKFVEEIPKNSIGKINRKLL